MYSDEDSKCCTDKLRIVREMSIQDLLDNEENCFLIVRVNEEAFQYLKRQTNEICLEIVKRNGRVLKYVKEQTSEICLEAVKQDGMALQFVKEQTPEICLAALKENAESFLFIKNQKLYMPYAFLEHAKQEDAFAIKVALYCFLCSSVFSLFLAYIIGLCVNLP